MPPLLKTGSIPTSPECPFGRREELLDDLPDALLSLWGSALDKALKDPALLLLLTASIPLAHASQRLFAPGQPPVDVRLKNAEHFEADKINSIDLKNPAAAQKRDMKCYCGEE